jgi:hypothetical protein
MSGYLTGVQQYGATPGLSYGFNGGTPGLAPGFIIGPDGAPMFVPSGAAGWRAASGQDANQSQGSTGALGAALGGGGTQGQTSGTAGATSGNPSSGGLFGGGGIAGTGITGRDIASGVGSLAGSLAGAGLGPLGALALGLGGRFLGTTVYDALNPSAAASTAPPGHMEPVSEPSVGAFGGDPANIGFGAGALSGTGVGALNSIGDITSGPAAGPAAGALGVGGVGGLADITAGGPGGGGNAADIAEVNAGNPGENVSGSGLHARGGRIRRRRGGALAQALGAFA